MFLILAAGERLVELRRPAHGPQKAVLLASQFANQ
jgi:hypothetical protein